MGSSIGERCEGFAITLQTRGQSIARPEGVMAALFGEVSPEERQQLSESSARNAQKARSISELSGQRVGLPSVSKSLTMRGICTNKIKSSSALGL